MGRRIGYLIVLFLLVATSAPCKDLFVSTTGSDAVTYANNDIDHPWLTILKAMQNVQAGDVVYFREGTYTIPSGGITITTGFSAGSSGSPIRFTSYPGETATWYSTQTNVTIRVGRDYWHFDNLDFLHEPSGSMSGDRGFFQCGYSTTGANGFWVKDSTFEMTGCGDNYGAVHLKMESGGCNLVEIENNVIVNSNAGRCSGTTNTSGIITFLNKTVKILNNEIYGPPMGIYIKHGSSDTTCANYDFQIKNNWVRYNYRRAFFNNSHCVVVENNIFDGRGASGDSSDNGASQFNESNGGAGSDYVTINHNTFLGGVVFNEDDNGVQNATFTNNLVYDRVFNIHPYTYGTSGDGNVDADYNLYKTSTAVRVDNTNYTLAQWQSASSEDANALSATPTFTSTDFDSVDDFALTSGSAGYQACADGSDMGADITLVGVDAGEEDTTPPVRSNGSPSGTIEYTATVTLSLNTNETATCKWDTSSGTAYASMDNTFTNTNSTSHSHASVAVSEGANVFYVRCEDGSDNENTDDYSISFTVEEGTPPPSPVTNFNILSTGASTIGGGIGSLTIQ